VEIPRRRQRPGRRLAELRFDDSTWSTGKAQLGYGDNDEATVINSGPSGNRFITAYFRKSFPVRTPGDYFSLRLRVLCDDGRSFTSTA